MSPQPIADPSPGGAVLIGERHVLELIATGAPLGDVLDTLCRVIDEGSGLRSSVFLLDRGGGQLSLTAGPHVPEAWRRAVLSFKATPTAGACGAAVNRREQVIIPDVFRSPLLEEWREAAWASGIGALWSTPFFSEDGRVLGTFAVFDHESRAPSDAQLTLVDRATHLASIAVERHQTEERLRESEQRFSTAFYSSPASMSISRFADGRFLYVNDQFVTHFGYTRSEAIGKTSQDLGLWADPAEHDMMWRAVVEHGGAHSVEVQARTKSGAEIVVLLWLERIQVLGEECVLGINCDITDRKRAERALAESDRRARVVLDTLPVGVTVTDRDGNIVLTNPAAQRVWAEMIPSGPERYKRSKGWRHDTGQAISSDEWPSARARLKGETTVNEVIDIEAFDGTRRTVETSAAPLRDLEDRITGAVFTLDDVSAQKKAERELQDSLAQMRALSGRLMRAQDDERRRIAQMLHETTAQDLAALKMLLARLARAVGSTMSDADRSALAESIDLAERSMTGVRTLSYLLHPPFLDETGLVSALRWYASGFAERSGIKVDLDLPSTFERLPQEVETTLFRVVQETLINIHHHAGSPTASIRLRVEGYRLMLEIEDRGCGMPSHLIAELPTGGGALGVGIAGMRERLQQLGGTLDIESSGRGTTVRANIPLSPGAP